MENPNQKLARFVGEWSCQETYHAGGYTPEEVKSTQANDSIRWGPGQNSVIANYQSDSAIGHYEAHNIITWDASDDAFYYVFLDSFGSFQRQRGTLDGDTVTFTSPDQFGDQDGTLRRTYSFANGSQQLVVDFTDAEGNITKLVTIEKTRD